MKGWNYVYMIKVIYFLLKYVNVWSIFLDWWFGYYLCVYKKIKVFFKVYIVLKVKLKDLIVCLFCMVSVWMLLN